MVSKVMGEGELKDRAKVIFAELEKKKREKEKKSFTIIVMNVKLFIMAQLTGHYLCILLSLFQFN